MDANELKLLQENNALLHAIIEQNKLIFDITQKNIQYYSKFSWWSEGNAVKRIRKKLDDLYQKITVTQTKE